MASDPNEKCCTGSFVPESVTAGQGAVVELDGLKAFFVRT
jgi:hypothetical protein